MRTPDVSPGEGRVAYQQAQHVIGWLAMQRQFESTYAGLMSVETHLSVLEMTRTAVKLLYQLRHIVLYDPTLDAEEYELWLAEISFHLRGYRRP